MPGTIDRIKEKSVEDGYGTSLHNRPTTRVYGRIAEGDVEVNLAALNCSHEKILHARLVFNNEALCFHLLKTAGILIHVNHQNKQVLVWVR